MRLPEDGQMKPLREAGGSLRGFLLSTIKPLRWLSFDLKRIFMRNRGASSESVTFNLKI
jgi:hypothetical protein